MCNYTITEIYGTDAAKVAALMDTGYTDDNGMAEYSLDKVVPMPGDVFCGDIGSEKMKKYPGVKNWLGWRTVNWGTKWDLSEGIVSGGVFSFKTAWAMPAPVLEKIAKDHPEWVFSARFADEEIENDRVRGVWEFADGTHRERPLSYEEAMRMWGIADPGAGCEYCICTECHAVFPSKYKHMAGGDPDCPVCHGFAGIVGIPDCMDAAGILSRLCCGAADAKRDREDGQ